LSDRLTQRSPLARIHNDQQRLDELLHRATLSLQASLQYRRVALTGFQKSLLSLNPQSVLGRGYAILTQPTGSVVRSIAQAQPGDVLDARLQDGHLSTQVTGIHKAD
jgi:exodeoxyribonuclease VII large subunit